eukprot:m.366212 g.366212  ORF g.366212 m.366212 type:complete len:530 (-) comp35081_c0_seq1:84-1673(-)
MNDLPDDLSSCSRKQLQALCKERQIKANSKTVVLIEALMHWRVEHAPPTQLVENEEGEAPVSCCSDASRHVEHHDVNEAQHKTPAPPPLSLSPMCSHPDSPTQANACTPIQLSTTFTLDLSASRSPSQRESAMNTTYDADERCTEPTKAPTSALTPTLMYCVVHGCVVNSTSHSLELMHGRVVVEGIRFHLSPADAFCPKDFDDNLICGACNRENVTQDQKYQHQRQLTSQSEAAAETTPATATESTVIQTATASSNIPRAAVSKTQRQKRVAGVSDVLHSKDKQGGKAHPSAKAKQKENHLTQRQKARLDAFKPKSGMACKAHNVKAGQHARKTARAAAYASKRSIASSSSKSTSKPTCAAQHTQGISQSTQNSYKPVPSDHVARVKPLVGAATPQRIKALNPVLPGSPAVRRARGETVDSPRSLRKPSQRKRVARDQRMLQEDVALASRIDQLLQSGMSDEQLRSLCTAKTGLASSPPPPLRTTGNFEDRKPDTLSLAVKSMPNTNEANAAGATGRPRSLASSITFG